MESSHAATRSCRFWWLGGSERSSGATPNVMGGGTPNMMMTEAPPAGPGRAACTAPQVDSTGIAPPPASPLAAAAITFPGLLDGGVAVSMSPVSMSDEPYGAMATPGGPGAGGGPASVAQGMAGADVGHGGNVTNAVVVLPDGRQGVFDEEPGDGGAEVAVGVVKTLPNGDSRLDATRSTRRRRRCPSPSWRR